MTSGLDGMPWGPLAGVNTPTSIASMTPSRTGIVAIGVVAGTVRLNTREIREDGRLGAPLELVEFVAGSLLVIPPDPEGLLLEWRVSHDAEGVVLDPVASVSVQPGDLDSSIRSYFDDGDARRAWLAADAREDDGWARIVGDLGTIVTERAKARVASARTRLRDRIARLGTLDDEMLGEAVRVMATPESVTTEAIDPRLTDRQRAIRAVIEATGITVSSQDLGGDAGETSVRDPIGHAARRWQVRHRGVSLDGDWWRENGGPLLTHRREDGAAVALLPIRGGYRAVEYLNGETREIPRVDRTVASALADEATMFYRPLPAGRGRLIDLLRIVGAGNLTDVLMVVAITLGASALIALVPILTGLIVGTVIPSVERVQLVFVGLLLVGLAFSRGLVQVVAGISFLRIETRSSYQVIAALVDRILRLPTAAFRGSSAGDLTQRVMAVEQVRSALTQSVLSVVVSLAASTSNLGVLLYYDSGMAITALAVIAVELLAIGWLAARMSRFDYEMSVAKGELDGFGLDLLSGIRQIRIQGSRRRALARLLVRLGRVGTFNYRVGLVGIQLTLVTTLAATLAMAVVFVEFTAGIRTTGVVVAMNPGGFVAFITALTAFLGAVIGVSPAIRAIANMVPQIRRIRPLLTAPTEAAESGRDAITLRGGLSATGITFGYGPDLPPVLDGVDIEARPGEFIAIVGRTGCGKSTLMSILLGLEKPDAGRVHYDGVPLDSLDASMVRSQVGVVMQANEVLPGSVQSTILGIGADRDLDDAWAAARLVGMADEIDAMPMGMFTMVSASSLSQSQLQRLLMARALVDRPRVLFLDEATSALDNASQSAITRTIDGLGATRVVIAHRLSTIRNADRIYVLDRGRVVQSGTFEELVAADGHFQNLMAGQIS